MTAGFFVPIVTFATLQTKRSRLSHFPSDSHLTADAYPTPLTYSACRRLRARRRLRRQVGSRSAEPEIYRTQGDSYTRRLAEAASHRRTLGGGIPGRYFSASPNRITCLCWRPPSIRELRQRGSSSWTARGRWWLALRRCLLDWVLHRPSLNVYARYGLVMLVRIHGQVRHSDRRIREPDFATGDWASRGDSMVRPRTSACARS